MRRQNTVPDPLLSNSLSVGRQVRVEHRDQSGAAGCRAGLDEVGVGGAVVEDKGHELVAEPGAAELVPGQGRAGVAAVAGEESAEEAGRGAPGEAEGGAEGGGEGVVDGGAGELEDAGAERAAGEGGLDGVGVVDVAGEDEDGGGGAGGGAGGGDDVGEGGE
jgi:hypothetical protein